MNSKIKFHGFLLILLGSLFSLSLHAEEWTLSGLGGGGGIEQPSISPHDGNQAFVITDVSGVYKTNNFGTDWSLLPFRTNGQNGINDNGRSSPIQFTSDPQIIYANNRGSYQPIMNNTNSGQVSYAVKSSDGGQTFQKIPNSFYYQGLSIQIYADPTSTNRILINTENTILYSNNGGTSFVPTNISSTPAINTDGDIENVLLIAGVFWNGDEIVIATNGGLYKSDQTNPNTVNFTTVSSNAIQGSITTFAAAKNPGGQVRFFAVTYPTSFGWNIHYPRNHGEIDDPSDVKAYKMNWSTNPGNWQNINYPSDLVPFWVATSLNDIDTVYLAGVDINPWSRPAVVKSSNGNLNTWEFMFITDNCKTLQGINCTLYTDASNHYNQNIASSWIAASQNWENELTWSWSSSAEGFAVSPNDSSRLILTSVGIHTSTDGGSNWQQAYTKQTNPAGSPTPLNESSQRYETNGIDPTLTWSLEWTQDNTMLAAANDVYGMLSNNMGTSWRSMASIMRDPDTYRIIKTSGNKLYAASATENDIYISPSHIRNFELGFTKNSCLATPATRPKLDANHNEVIGGAVSQSSDNGLSWQVLQEFHCPVVWVEPDKNNINKLYASVVQRDYGGIYVADISSSNNFTLLSSGPTGTVGNPYIIISLDNGDLLTSWSVIQDKNTGQLSENSAGIFKWSSASSNWQSFTQPLSMRHWTKDILVDPDDASIWYAAAFNRYKKYSNQSNDVANGGGGLFRFTNNGANYQRISPPELYRVESITINPSNTDEAYITTENDGLWKTANIKAISPTFTRVESFLFKHSFRTFYDPAGTIWVTTFGGGMWKHPGAPVLPPAAMGISPANGDTINNPITYTWNAVVNSTWYYLWVNDSSGNKIKQWYTATQANCATGTGICSATPTTELVQGLGEWWVQTWNDIGYGPWSSAMSFNLSNSPPPPVATTLISPNGTITDSTPTYTWNAVANSSWYYLWVDDSSGNKIKQWYTAAQASCSSGTGTCSITPTTALVQGAGKWWIKTWNNTAHGPWTSAMNFNF